MRFLSLWTQLAKFSMKRMAAYKGDFVMRLLGLLPMFLVMILILSIPYQYVHDLAGWTKDEVLIVLGLYYMAEGLSWTLFKGGIFGLEDHVSAGTLDGILLKPVNSIFLLSFFDFDVSRLVDVLIGSVLVVWVIVTGSTGVDVIHVLGGTAAFLMGQIIVFSLYFSFNCLSFWMTETYLGHVASPIFTVARFPVDLWGQQGAKLLYWILPIAFMTTVPAGVLVGKMSFVWVGVSAVVAMMMLLVIRVLWRAGVRNYAGVGS